MCHGLFRPQACGHAARGKPWCRKGRPISNQHSRKGRGGLDKGCVSRTPSHAVSEVDIESRMDELETLRRRLDAMGREVEAMNRLAVLGTLAATLAHEFNNVATPAANYARLGADAIRRPTPDAADLAFALKSFGKCHAAAEKAARLSAAILELAKPNGEANRHAIVLDAVNDALTAMVRSPEQDGVHLAVTVPDDLAAAVEPVQLEHLLLNLLLNARKALLAVPMGRRQLKITAEVEADHALRLSVSDTGCGIAPESLATIFEPFHTGGGGSGLGLSLCRRIAERHGGRIAVESRPGEGSQFTLTLPRAA